MSAFPQLRQAYYKEEPNGVWRPPEINETCCARPHLADLLDDVATSGPDVLYNGSYTQVSSRPEPSHGQGLYTGRTLQKRIL